MKKFFILLFLILLILPAFAQLPLTGAGKGAPGGGSSYTGVGDIVAMQVYLGLRCYNNAYSGNVADIWDSATGNTTETLITCSSGGTLNETVNSLATTCSGGCRVKTLYDQSGNTNCTGAACDVTQATNANRPTFTTSGCTGLSGTKTWCMSATGTQTLTSAANFNGTGTQPYTFGCSVTFDTYAGNDACLGSGGATVFEIFTPQFALFAGSQANSTAITATTWYSAQAVFNSTTSTTLVNGSSTTSLNAGTSTNSGNKVNVFTDNFGNPHRGKGVEFYIATGAVSGGNQTSIESNIRAYWGF